MVGENVNTTTSSTSNLRLRPRSSQKMANLEEEEDEEMEEEIRQPQKKTRQQSAQDKNSKIKSTKSPKQQEQDVQMDLESSNGSDEEDEESDESEPEIPEMLVPNRSRRPNAGRRMQELLNQQMDKDGGGAGEKDDFYNDVNVYGGFQELDQDEDFISPPHSSADEAEQDEVDSDFDRPEEEDKDEEDAANRAVVEAERAERKRKKQKRKQMIERNKNWAIERINKLSVPENSCDAKTQKQRLQEAKKTAELNIASLKRFEQFELERKKRQAKSAPKLKLEGPRIKEIMQSDGKHLIILPELQPKNKLFPRPERREFTVCAVTKRPARYIDPLTKLPYADANAFRIIREKYKEFLANNGIGVTSTEERPSSTDGFARQKTPAKQRKLTSSEAGTSNGKTQTKGRSKSREDRIKIDDQQ